MHYEKWCSLANFTTDKVVVENNSLSKDEEEKEHEHGALQTKLPTLDLGTGALRDEHGNPIPGTAGLPGGVPISRGSTGRTAPTSLGEKLAMDQAKSNPGEGQQLPLPMSDPRWPKSDGWVKMAQNINGIEIHYVQNTKTGQVDDFKFK